MTKKLFVSIVICLYNEEENIKELTERIINVIKNKFDYEIIYCVAGTDKSLDIIKQFKNKKIKTFYSKKPNGLGKDFRFGFSKVSNKADYVITMDADLNHQPEEITKLLNVIQNKKADIVIGSRHIKGGKRLGVPLWKKGVSDLTNIIFYIITKSNIKDKTSGYRVYRKNVIKFISNKYSSNNYEFLLEILLIAIKNKMKIVETPIVFKYRTRGTSKMELFKTGKGYLRLLFKKKTISINKKLNLNF